MARADQTFPDNADGEFFVDRTCINCDTCRQLAPSIFADSGQHSYVRSQPASEAEQIEASHALFCCPTASIGTRSKSHRPEALDDFPMQLTENVFYLGFNSLRSRGGNSYLITRPDGNWMVDAPRWSSRLAARIQALGGIDIIFSTCRTNMGDQPHYATHFGARTAASGATFADGTLIPIQGHTMLLYRDAALFSGDLLAWDREQQVLGPSTEAVRYSPADLVTALGRLDSYRLTAIFPAHGARLQGTAEFIRPLLSNFVDRSGAGTGTAGPN